MYCRWKSFIINFKNNLILVVSKKTDIPWTKKKKYKKLTVFGWVALESHIVRWSGAYFSVRTVSTTANCNDTRMTIVVGRCWCVLVVLVVLMGVCEKRWKKSLSHTWVARYFPWVRHPSSGTRDLVRCTMKVHCPRVHISCVVGFAKHSQTSRRILLPTSSHLVCGWFCKAFPDLRILLPHRWHSEYPGRIQAIGLQNLRQNLLNSWLTEDPRSGVVVGGGSMVGGGLGRRWKVGRSTLWSD